MLSNAQKIRNYVRITNKPFTSADVRAELDIPFQTVKNNLHRLKAEKAIQVISVNKGRNVYTKSIIAAKELNPRYSRSWTPPKDVLNQILKLDCISRAQIMRQLKLNGCSATHYINYLIHIKVISPDGDQFKIINPLPDCLPKYRRFNEKDNKK